MLKVYFETNTTAYLVATFETEELYLKCLPVLEAAAEEAGYTVTEECT